ncbi:neuronal calcium sensor 2 isoform X1 [Limulus polyphemus]|uniref:Neuronal calcium sensor 2 isoform X1 n=1 Tax=Limulus polyphemus TaxID=6850 RepID=A0ABM1BCR4_LIMPO|nr:neuronal calcium sensor 2 isoform X1 [Limulus polyphemus]XP_013779362.1 neuronal calcium sensor 2 isoform X1 [Limulus polyphemus]XP_022247157.1 neuronal calcium sensor 2 isoform X1 [Limulus polyphemus]XP_022247158.1 neuronal calcium sensor 2 isoform X1 [Limulus polyphemus]XP_022247159.1 neuronal calcium sensor 2 isoform X1 [Limulus polyphemus]XP_022247160.1 neuronal calcium sensor 2 isoform X1 [Limulus polyphemus]
MGCSASKNTDITNEDLEFLKKRTGYDEKTIKELYEGFKQDCPDRKLSKEKFVEMYKMFFSSGNPEKFCENVFRTFDVDKNDHIDFKEFLLAIGITSRGSSEEKLKWAFRMYDINGDGLIEKEEMTKIVQALYEMLGQGLEDMPVDTPQERTALIFEKMDSNHDSRLSLEEFLNGCTEDPKLGRFLSVIGEEQRN